MYNGVEIIMISMSESEFNIHLLNAKQEQYKIDDKRVEGYENRLKDAYALIEKLKKSIDQLNIHTSYFVRCPFCSIDTTPDGEIIHQFERFTQTIHLMSSNSLVCPNTGNEIVNITHFNYKHNLAKNSRYNPLKKRPTGRQGP